MSFGRCVKVNRHPGPDTPRLGPGIIGGDLPLSAHRRETVRKLFLICCLLSGSAAFLLGPVAGSAVEFGTVEPVTIETDTNIPVNSDAGPSAAIANEFTAHYRKSLGHAIFSEGKGRDGRPITALFGSTQTGPAQSRGLRLEGGAVACKGCHGVDGRGGGESFVQAPDIRWRSLTVPYGARRPGGQPRPAYTRDSFRTAISAGTASDGRKLDPAMPRFDLASDELDALVEYLQSMESTADGQQKPALVMLLPSKASALHEQLAERLRQCAMNTVTTKRFELLRYDSEQQALESLRTRLANGHLAALFASYAPGWESRLSVFVQQNLLISLMPLLQREPEQTERLLFRLPASRAQVLALLQAAAQRGAQLYLPAGQAGNDDQDLRQWAQSKADELGISVMTAPDPSAGAGAGAGTYEWLWLTLANSPAVYKDGKPGNAVDLALLQIDRILVPSTHIAGLPVIQSAEVTEAVEIDVAFPYKTRFSDTTSPVTPLQVWHALGCELLERMPALPSNETDIAAWRQQVIDLAAVDMGSWLSVPAQSTLLDDSARVSIERLLHR